MMCSYFCQRKFLWEANIAQLVILNLALVTVRIEICWKWANVRIWYLKYLEVGIVMQTREGNELCLEVWKEQDEYFINI